MTTCYLDVDDEITSAIARLRAVRDGEAVLIVPPGSHIATSRINFKLLAREATERRLNVVAVSDEPQVRALAISAGLPAYDSLGAAEQALAGFRQQDKQLADRIGRPPATGPARRGAARPQGAPAETLVLPWPLVEAPSVAGRPKSEPEVGAAAPAGTTTPPASRATPAGASARPSVVAAPSVRLADEVDWGPGAGVEIPSRPDVERRRRQRRVGVAPVLVVALLALLVAGVGYGAYLFLPTATITLVPAATAVSMPAFSITADPTVAVSDADAGVVPADRIEVPIRVSKVFPATGVEARETRATGTARFRSENTLNDVPIPEGTQIATADDIEFVTTEPATVRRASFGTGPTTVDVEIRAVRPGPRGNVAAGAITQLPNNLANQLITVRNQGPTMGGRRVEEMAVTEDDYDAAVASLLAQLDSTLATTLADPATTPRGLKLFPETAQFGESTVDPVAGNVIGTVAETFTLAVDNVAVVVAVNESLVDELAAERLRSTIDPPQVMVGDQVSAGRTAGVVVGQTVVYEASPTAIAYAEPDRATLLEQVRGTTVAEAEQILAAYGMVDIVLWPEFVDRLPDQAARIGLTIQPPSEVQ